MLRTTGCLASRLCRTSSLVTYCPVLVFLGLSMICSLPKRMSPTCFGLPMLNVSPASLYISCSYCFMRSVNILDVSCRASVSRQTPFSSMSASTRTSGISMFQKSSSKPSSFRRGSSRCFRRKVMSASSAAYSQMSVGERSRIFFCFFPFGPISSSMWMVR